MPSRSPEWRPLHAVVAKVLRKARTESSMSEVTNEASERVVRSRKA